MVAEMKKMILLPLLCIMLSYLVSQKKIIHFSVLV